mgnify:CR=1 FL=1
MIPIHKLRLLTASAFALAAMAPAAFATPSQAALDVFADHLGYRYTVLDNHAGPGEFSSELDLSLPNGPVPQGWSLYFGMVNAVRTMDSDVFDLKHINQAFPFLA